MKDIRMGRLRHLARLMRWVAFVLMAALLGTAVWSASRWIQDPGAAIVASNISGLDASTLTPWRQWLVVLCGAVPFLLALSALSRLATLFGAYAQGEILTEYTTSVLRGAAGLLLTTALANMAFRTVFVLLVSWGNAPGQRMLSIGFGSNDAFLLLMAGSFFVIGHVLHAAMAIEEENKGFV